MTSDGEAESQAFEITEDFLFENFIQPFTKEEPAEAGTELQALDQSVDLEKLDFSETAYDKYYYKNKYPNFDMGVCEILEKCSIDKQRQQAAPDAGKSKARKPKKKKTYVEFN